RIALTGKLHENLVAVSAASGLNGRLGETQGVDASLDGFKRLSHGRFLDLSDGAGTQRERVAVLLAGGGNHVPNVGVLRAHNVAELGKLRWINIAHEDVGIVGAPQLIEVNVLGAQLVRESMDPRT